MAIPKRIPGLVPLTIVWGVATLVWSALEGNLALLAGLSILSAVVAVAHLGQRIVGGRAFTLRRWLALASLGGLLVGMLGAVLMLVFMALKTGLHGHGPEFTGQEIIWAWQQVPRWSVVGLLAGLGLGLLRAARPRKPG